MSEDVEGDALLSPQLILDHISGLMVVDCEGVIRLTGSETARGFGLAEAPVPGQRLADLFPGELADQLMETIRLALEDGEDRSHTELKHPQDDGSPGVYAVTVHPLPDESGRLALALLTANDVTELHKIERHLVRTEKMAAIGTMISGLTHELRNPLSGLSGQIQLMQRYGEWDEKTRARLSKMMGLTDRMGRMIDDFLKVARRASFDIVSADLNEIVNNTISAVAFQNIFDNIQIEREYAADLVIRCDPTSLHLVFLNLILNAAEAMEGKGKLVLCTERRGRRAAVSVSDTGHGIPDEIRPRIFDAFFSTKDPGRGVGLGLSIAHRIVSEHGGLISVRETSAKGTTIEVMLPQSHPEAV